MEAGGSSSQSSADEEKESPLARSDRERMLEKHDEQAAAIHSQPKLNEFVLWFRSKEWTMRALFRFFGRFIGTWPIACLVAFFIIASMSVMAVKMELRDRVRDGYTPRDSRAYAESKALREFSHLTGDPMMTTVILRSRDGSSMLDNDKLLSAVELLQFLKSNLSVPLDEKQPDGEQRRYSDFCGHHCQQNDIVDYFALEAIKLRRGDLMPLLAGTNLSYPVARIMGMEVHLERNFYGVTVDTNVTSKNHTNMLHCQLIVFTFTADISTPSDEEVVARWEQAVFEHINSRSKEEPMEALVIGAEIVDREMNKDSQRMTPYFAAGFIGALVFIAVSAWASLYLYGTIDFKRHTGTQIVTRLLLPVGVCLVPFVAISTTFGVWGVLGLRCNSLMLIMPFLIMGIGVNDSFLVVHHWLRESHAQPRAVVMGKVFEDVGPSITMTTLTNVISFMVGALMPTEEIALFCAGSACAMGLAYLYTLLFFGSVLALHLEPEGDLLPKPTDLQKKVLGIFDKMLQCYVRLLQNNIARSAFLLIWLAFLVGGISGALQINSKLETEKILPKETPIHAPNRIIEQVVWPEYYPVIVMMRAPFDVANTAQRAEFFAMVEDFERLRGCRGANGTLLWLRDYERYFDFVADGDMDDDFFEDSQEDGKRKKIVKGHYDYSQLKGFLESPLTKHFAGMVTVNHNMSPPVRQFSFVVAYRDHKTWDDRIAIQQQWREIVDKYPSLNATIWNVNGMFVDQMLSLKSVAVQSIVATLACMAVVCICFIQKLIAVAVATLSIGSIAIGTIGYLGIWELDLDPVTICAILISIGMSVDFTAHISMYYVNCPRIGGRTPCTHTRLTQAIGAVFWPALQGNASTLICVLPLIALHNYIPLVFVKTITLVVIIGTAHGLLLIPMLLSVLPSSIVDFDLLTYRDLRGNGAVLMEEGKEMADMPSPTLQQLAERDALLLHKSP